MIMGSRQGMGWVGALDLGSSRSLPLALLELVCTLSPGAEREITLLCHHLVMKRNGETIRHKLSKGADGCGPHGPERVCGVRSKRQMLRPMRGVRDLLRKPL